MPEDKRVRDSSLWRNNKNGQIYCVLSVGQHSETLEKMVIYASQDDMFWIRPYDLFLEKFTPLLNGNPAAEVVGPGE